MKILIVTATVAEAQGLLSSADTAQFPAGTFVKCGMSSAGKQVYLIITGVGMINTCYHFTNALRDVKPDVCINAGIAGAYNRALAIGELVMVQNECFADLGAEDGDDFIGMEELELAQQRIVANELNLCTGPPADPFKKVNANSVNTVRGNEVSIKNTLKKFPADVESMEGAAFMMVCQKEKIKHLQIRSISNYIERRNRESWNIPLAIKNLNTTLVNIINEL